MNSGELKVDVPLASVEDVDEDDGSNASSSANSPRPASTSSSSAQKPAAALRRPPLPAAAAAAAAAASKSRSSSANGRRGVSPRFNCLTDGGGDSAAGSLEDLVNSFDEKITKVFQDYQENVSKIAPVQVLNWVAIARNYSNGLYLSAYHYR